MPNTLNTSPFLQLCSLDLNPYITRASLHSCALFPWHASLSLSFHQEHLLYSSFKSSAEEICNSQARHAHRCSPPLQLLADPPHLLPQGQESLHRRSFTGTGIHTACFISVSFVVFYSPAELKNNSTNRKLLFLLLFLPFYSQSFWKIPFSCLPRTCI